MFWCCEYLKDDLLYEGVHSMTVHVNAISHPLSIRSTRTRGRQFFLVFLHISITLMRMLIKG